MTANVNSCNRDHRDLRAGNIYYLIPLQKEHIGPGIRVDVIFKCPVELALLVFRQFVLSVEILSPGVQKELKGTVFFCCQSKLVIIETSILVAKIKLSFKREGLQYTLLLEKPNQHFYLFAFLLLFIILSGHTSDYSLLLFGVRKHVSKCRSQGLAGEKNVTVTLVYILEWVWSLIMKLPVNDLRSYPIAWDYFLLNSGLEIFIVCNSKEAFLICSIPGLGCCFLH